MTWSTRRRNPDAVTAKIVLPVAAVLLSLLVFAIGGLVFAGKRTNDLAVERQRSLVMRASLVYPTLVCMQVAQVPKYDALDAAFTNLAEDGQCSLTRLAGLVHLALVFV